MIVPYFHLKLKGKLFSFNSHKTFIIFFSAVGDSCLTAPHRLAQTHQQCCRAMGAGEKGQEQGLGAGASGGSKPAAVGG